MNRKFILLGVIAVLLLQALIFNYFQMDNLEVLKRAETNLQARRQSLVQEKTELTTRLRKIKAQVEAMPPYMLSGFEDPEAVFVSFLDYLQDPALDVLTGPVRMGRWRYQTRPLPYHAVDFSFRYSFADNRGAEAFLGRLMDQERFLLDVKRFNARRMKQGRVAGDLTVSMLTPARFEWD
jgi:hypothetical protein